MRFTPPLVEGRLVARPNRFLTHVEVAGEVLRCFCPNPGRLTELLVEGTPALVRPMDRGADAATQWDHVALGSDDGFVIIDTRLANRLVREAYDAGRLPELPKGDLTAEVKHGASRLDFRVDPPDGRPTLVEVKSASLVERVDGTPVARFPDAPTTRGTRHVRELADAASDGHDAVVFWTVGRPGARWLEANRATDPDFADALVEAHEAGVRLLAREAVLTTAGVDLGREVPVKPI